jgi:hypothetical protein
MSHRISQICLAFGTFVWPLALYLYMGAYPGTVPPPRVVSSTDREVAERTAPPTDHRGSRVVVSENNRGQRASIFWQVPEPGRVHVTIEIEPPAEDAAPEASAPATAP